MPLMKSGSREAVSRNISEMVHAGHPQPQAVAAALRNARQYGARLAAGGPSIGANYTTRQVLHQGFLHSPVPGRTDKLPITVGGGSYVLPADHVAALGQGNSLAGANIVNKMFKMGPYGTPAPAMKSIAAHVPKLNPINPKAAPMPKQAAGGAPGAGRPTPIIAAGGEIVIPPDKIIEKFGSLKEGHAKLKQWILNTRAKHIKTLRGLKPPTDD